MSTPKTILLYNHATGTGHHESWTALFSDLLLARGFRVVCITPNVAALRSVLAKRGLATDENIHLLNMPPIVPPPPTFMKKINRVWVRVTQGRLQSQTDSFNFEGATNATAQWKPTLRERWSRNAHRYAQKTPEVRVTADLPLIVQIKRQILHVIVPPVWYTLQVLRAFFYRFYHPILHVGERCPSNLSIAANVALRQAPWKPDFILSMYSDIWLTHPYYWRKDLNIPLPWGGIRFMPFKRDIAGSEGYFRNSSFRGLCFLDELAVDNYGRRDPEKIFEFVPDVANDALPECRLPLVDEMCRLANGRKIVLLCGSIEGRKNVRMFCELSQLADSSQFFFALVGQVHRSTFSVEELSLLSTFIEAEAASTFYRDTYFEDESEMNAVINSADVIFAAYRDFSISSNMLSKAAGFRKPILVSDKYLMGARVKQYGIGFAVPEDSAIGILEGLERVIARPPLIENYLNFCRDSSCDGLSQRLEKFLMKCLKNGSK